MLVQKKLEGFGFMDKYIKTAVMECDHQQNITLFCNRIYKNKKGLRCHEQYFIKEILLPNISPADLEDARDRIQKFQ